MIYFKIVSKQEALRIRNKMSHTINEYFKIEGPTVDTCGTPDFTK